MSHLKYYTYPGAGETLTNTFGYSQSVNINGVLEISGQGGWSALSLSLPPTFLSPITPNQPHISVF